MRRIRRRSARARTHALPDDLTDLEVSGEDLQDALGFRFKYTLDDDKQGYRVSAIGVPDRLQNVERQIRRRLADEALAN